MSFGSSSPLLSTHEKEAEQYNMTKHQISITQTSQATELYIDNTEEYRRRKRGTSNAFIND